MPTAAAQPRYWWLKRIGLASAILLVLLVIAWLLWNWDANRRLNAAIAAIQARGEPLFPVDFSEAPVPDAENYVKYLLQAMPLISPTVYFPSQSNLDYRNHLPLPPEWYTMADQAMVANRNALMMMRTARQHPMIDWGFRNQKSPVVNGLVANHSLNDRRNMANLLADAAMYQHLHGNDAEAVETLLDLFTMSDATARFQSMIDYLVSMGIDSVGFQRIHFIAPALRVSGDGLPPSTNPSDIPASRAQVVALMEQLRKIDPQKRFQHAIESDRMLTLDEGQWTAAQRPLLGPMYKLDSVRALGLWDKLLEESRSTTRPFSSIAMRRSDDPISQQVYAFSRGIPITVRIVEYNARLETELRMAQVALAARLYQFDHDGHWPPNLEALVPAFLPAVPLASLRDGGKPLKYLILNDGKRPVVYAGPAVAEADEKWLITLLPAEPIYERDDRVYKNNLNLRDLSRFEGPPPTTAPASTTQPM